MGACNLVSFMGALQNGEALIHKGNCFYDLGFHKFLPPMTSSSGSSKRRNLEYICVLQSPLLRHRRRERKIGCIFRHITKGEESESCGCQLNPPHEGRSSGAICHNVFLLHNKAQLLPSEEYVFISPQDIVTFY